MISPVEENVTTDNIKKLAQIRDEYRGRYYTIEEMSNMSGVPVDQLKTLVNARRSSPFWTQVYIQKSQRVQIEKAGISVNYYCPYSALIPASKNAMQSAEDRAVNLDSRPTICPPGRRFGSFASPVFRSERIENSSTSDDDMLVEDAAALSSKRPKYLDGPRFCSIATTLFTNGHPRHGKIYDPVCIVFQLCFFLNDRDESSFLEALLSMANDPVKEKQKRRRFFGTCGGITLARVLRTSKENTKEQREIGFNLVVRKARLKYAVITDINQYNRDVVGISSEGDHSFLVYRPPPPKPNRSTSAWSDLWTRSRFTNEV